ncbi:hypothetical protein QYM36_007550 [Artemia franciscana]|uniref:Uncharacterized protein n=1 Tax=Artemia franciscana TaxID=6661 RepID=A0AA88LK65_ARTSF|nr:hypothetical protein QYM36_007550 [Artemia franciscana]
MMNLSYYTAALLIVSSICCTGTEAWSNEGLIIYFEDPSDTFPVSFIFKKDDNLLWDVTSDRYARESNTYIEPLKHIYNSMYVSRSSPVDSQYPKRCVFDPWYGYSSCYFRELDYEKCSSIGKCGAAKNSIKLLKMKRIPRNNYYDDSYVQTESFSKQRKIRDDKGLLEVLRLLEMDTKDKLLKLERTPQNSYNDVSYSQIELYPEQNKPGSGNDLTEILRLIEIEPYTKAGVLEDIKVMLNEIINTAEKTKHDHDQIRRNKHTVITKQLDLFNLIQKIHPKIEDRGAEPSRHKGRIIPNEQFRSLKQHIEEVLAEIYSSPRDQVHIKKETRTALAGDASKPLSDLLSKLFRWKNSIQNKQYRLEKTSLETERCFDANQIDPVKIKNNVFGVLRDHVSDPQEAKGNIPSDQCKGKFRMESVAEESKKPSKLKDDETDYQKILAMLVGQEEKKEEKRKSEKKIANEKYELRRAQMQKLLDSNEKFLHNRADDQMNFELGDEAAKSCVFEQKAIPNKQYEPIKYDKKNIFSENEEPSQVDTNHVQRMILERIMNSLLARERAHNLNAGNVPYEQHGTEEQPKNYKADGHSTDNLDVIQKHCTTAADHDSGVCQSNNEHLGSEEQNINQIVEMKEESSETNSYPIKDDVSSILDGKTVPKPIEEATSAKVSNSEQDFQNKTKKQDITTGNTIEEIIADN